MKPAKTYVRDNVPLSRFGVLVAQLESIVASATQQLPDPILCFDLLSDLISAIDDEPKESILLWQRKCEDALYSLLVLGARRPVRHLASVAMAKIISKGDTISIYSRASSFQGFLSDGKRREPQRVAGAAQCLGELYRHFGRRITSGLLETTIIATKLMKFNEEFVRKEALLLLQKALEGSGGTGASSAYSEAFRLITRSGTSDKSFIVRIATANCLKAFASIGGPGLGVGELDSSASVCAKALEDPLSSVRDAFAEALGSLLALGMNPEAQVQPRGKGPFPPAKKLDGGLQRHLTLPFVKASGIRMKDLRVGITLSWVYFLQAIRVKYLLPDGELKNYAPQIIDMLRADNAVDAHSLACILYILRVGVTDQMTEPTQREFLVFLGKQLESPDLGPTMRIAVFRTLSYTLKTLGEVPMEFKEVCDDTVVAAVSHPSQLVQIEAALTLQVLAEVDPTCVGGLISYTVTTLSASRDSVSFEKGSNLKVELDTLHGQATVLAALVYISPKLPLGYPARLPMSILEVSKRMLEESSRNPLAATIEKEAGWLLLSSLLSSMPTQELEDQVFDILSLWASLFSGNPQHELNQSGDLTSSIRVWSSAIEALAAFVRCFVAQGGPNNGILLQPVMVYLSSALEYITLLQGNRVPQIKQEVDVFIIRTLRAYQSLPEPMAYKTDHPKIIQLCTVPFRDASRCEESSCLRLLLDKRDAWLGPWTPGRDWLEDELRAFQGGKDGIMPCVWDSEASSFPQPETINKMLVNQMLLCFGIMFASQDSSGMLFLLGTVEQSLKASKKQTCHGANVTNICVGLLTGLKALIVTRPQPLGSDILNSALAIFQNILAEGDICASHRRAASEGLGLLARLGNDTFTARMMRSLLNDLSTTTDSSYAGSIAFALGCIHCSAGGMALSTLVPATVNSVTLLAKSTATGLQLWSLHGLLLTIEAAGFSYVSHVQATLGLAVDILLSEENGLVELQQVVGRLINAIVAVLGPELAPGSIFFSRCKSVIAEISSQQETATLLESVRFTQHLVLFAPQAVSVHSHVQTLLSTLSSRQPTLRHLAISTLRHLIEKDPDHIIDEQIEENLFHVLDEETDSEIGNLVRAAIMRLLHASSPSCPSHWILTCRNLILATSGRRAAEISTKSDNVSIRGSESDSRLDFGDDDQNMVPGSQGATAGELVYEASSINSARDKHLRFRTRVFAAESLSHLPLAVGNDPAHFDLSLARKTDKKLPADWLVLHLQELISLAYQISTIQFEKMRPIGVGLLCGVVDKFERSPDPDLPGHLLLEQYQAQLVSAIRTALDSSSGPVLLEAGLQLATKIMTGGILGSDQAAIKRIFALISRPLNDFKDIYYPSFAEWISCKIKIRLLAAHASLKCYTYAFLQRHQSDVPHEYLSLLPLFAKSASVLGKYWLGVLKDYCGICLFLNIKTKWNPFLDGIQSPLVSMKLKPILEETWPVILQALALDAVPAAAVGHYKSYMEDAGRDDLISGYSMVRLDLEEYEYLWGFALLILFQQQNPTFGRQIIPLSLSKAKSGGDVKLEESDSPDFRLHEIVFPVFQFLSGERFFRADFLSVDLCLEFLQVLSYSINLDDSWNSLAISVLTQIIQNCPGDFLETEKFAYLCMELPVSYMHNFFFSHKAILLEQDNVDSLVSQFFAAAKALISRFDPKVQKQIKSMIIALQLLGYNCIREASTELCYSKAVDFLKSVNLSLSKLIKDFSENGRDDYLDFGVVIGTCMGMIADLTKDCIKGIHLLQHGRLDIRKLLQLKLSFSLEETVALVKLGYLIECSGDNRDGISYPLFKHSADNIHAVLNHANLQVQAIGLQVLKTAVQRSSSVEDCTFLLFFTGELLEDVLTIIQNMLKKPMGNQSVAILGECLRFLMLLQTLSKSSDCQRAFMDLLLNAILQILSATENDVSQEATDVKAIAVRLVSHLAQIPSSAVHFKDVLLRMPATHRQQLQGLILSNVTQDQNVSHTKRTTQLEIKLPVARNSQAEATAELILKGSEEKTLASSVATTYSALGNVDEVEEEEDDWDTFQSFHASTDVIEPGLKEEDAVEECVVDEKPKIETEVSPVIDLTSVNYVNGINSEEHVESASYAGGNEDNVEGRHSIHSRDIFSEPWAGEQEREELDAESAIIRDVEAEEEAEGSSPGFDRKLHETTKDPLDHLSEPSATSEDMPEIQTRMSAIDDRILSAEGVDSSNKLEGSSSTPVHEVKESDTVLTADFDGEAKEEQTVAKDHIDQPHYLSTASPTSTVKDHDSPQAGNILHDTQETEQEKLDKNMAESEQNEDLHQKNGNEPKLPQVEEGKIIDAEVYGEVDIDAERTEAAHKIGISSQDTKER